MVGHDIFRIELGDVARVARQTLDIGGKSFNTLGFIKSADQPRQPSEYFREMDTLYTL